MNVEIQKDRETKSSFLERLATVRIPWMFDRLASEHIVVSALSNTVAGVIPRISAMIAQILAAYPPGSVRFLFLDPVGLGQNFAAFHALGDYDEKLITNRVWSDRRHIRDRLEEIIEHIEGVIQKYLRADYESIDQYNDQAGEIAEAYRFVFIYGFPENFDAEACLALERIMANGSRCGVHVIMVWDVGKALPHGVKPAQIIQRSDHYRVDGDGLVHQEAENGNSVRFTLDAPPAGDVISQIVNKHGSLAKDNSRVEVPYDKLMQRVMTDYWSHDNSEGLIAPLGPTGARKIQQLVFGRQGTTAHHALLIGRTGSGKSNLLHVLIVSLSEIYSPEQLEIYLVDFKKGVEFKDYAVHKLPHARVVAIESELEFGLSVLRGMDDELTRRGEVFRDTGVQDIAACRQKTNDQMPRTLLIVDEFHELFAEEGSASQEALGIVERIARQGRSFGMHMILASQSISGLRLPRSILDQIGVRIALQCSEADSRAVLADDNGAARLLERAGEAIYNDQNGLIEGNSPFQTAYLTEDERDKRLAALRDYADNTYSDALAEPFIFEGSEPADFTACRPFHDALETWPNTTSSPVLNLWVGEPIAMLPAHTIDLKRQSGANVLIIDRNERLAFGVVFSSILSIAAQESPENVVFHIVDLSAADASHKDHSETFAHSFPHQANVYGRRGLEGVVAELAEEVGYRDLGDTGQMAKHILVLFGAQRARDLRREDTLSFAAPADSGNIHQNLGKILREGPEFGIHTMIWCDTVQSFSRIFDNSTLNEIGHRIAGALSSADSIKLFDEPVASKLERENRMICYDDENIGVYTPIRPYVPCDLSYVTALGKKLKKR